MNLSGILLRTEGYEGGLTLAPYQTVVVVVLQPGTGSGFRWAAAVKHEHNSGNRLLFVPRWLLWFEGGYANVHWLTVHRTSTSFSGLLGSTFLGGS